MENLEAQFTEEMRNIYREAKASCNYNASRFIQMVEADGGLVTARKLLNAPATSDGYFKLQEANRLDLTVEALVLQKPWRALFTDKELRIAKKRLPSTLHPKE